MSALPGTNASAWVATAPETRRYPALDRPLSVDVAVIGGGIAGLTAALLLKRAGRKVAVIEARRIGHQVTGRSTAKITSQHSLIYADLTERIGRGRARLYAEANQSAIERIARFADELNIDCAFERATAYTISTNPDRFREFELEVEAAKALGLPADLVRETSLPYPIAVGVRFDNQAQFNPTAYLAGLAAAVDGDGSHVFEMTRAVDAKDGRPATVETDRGTITAGDVIVATNLPFITQGEFHKKASPRAHVAVAATISSDRAPDGMYLNIDHPGHSLRSFPHGDRRMLVAISQSYKTGHFQDTAAMYRELADFVEKKFRTDPVQYRWANEDFDSQDRIPFVGRAAKDVEHLHVATGFSSWGISNGTAAGMVLADLLSGRSNPWAELYDATREPGEAPNRGQPRMLEQQEQKKEQPGSPKDLKPGESAVFKIGEEPVAVHCDAHGALHAVSAKCTHMGCEVQWNNGERTWDCPCHGSIFAVDGTVLHGPAVMDLEPKKV